MKKYSAEIQCRINDLVEPHAHFSTLRKVLILSSLVSSILKVVNHDNTNTDIIELLWASNVGEAHRTLSAPSKYSTNVGSISKSNQFFLIIDDLVVGTWPTCGWRDKKAQLGSPRAKCLCWSNRVTWRISVLPLPVVGSGYDPWCHFTSSLRLKATWGWLGRDENKTKQNKSLSWQK